MSEHHAARVRRWCAVVALVMLAATACSEASEVVAPTRVFDVDRSPLAFADPLPGADSTRGVGALHSSLQSSLTLYSEFVVLATRQVVDGGIDDSTLIVLDETTKALTASIGLALGTENALAFDVLWTSQIELIEDHAQAVRSDDGELIGRTELHLEQLEIAVAHFFETVTRGNASPENVEAAIGAHVEAVLAQTAAWAAGEHQRAFVLSLEAHRRAGVVARLVSNGISLDQPDLFPGTVFDDLSRDCARDTLARTALLAARFDTAHAQASSDEGVVVAARAALDARRNDAPSAMSEWLDSHDSLITSTSLDQLPQLHRNLHHWLTNEFDGQYRCIGGTGSG